MKAVRLTGEIGSAASCFGYKMSSNVSSCVGDSPSSSRHVSDVVICLTQNDVLFGRGAPIINYVGNVRFRKLVSTRKKEYNGTGRHQIKDEIARQIVLEVKRRNGRFLRKVERDGEAQQIGVPQEEPSWTIADEDIILEKVKQALRDKEPERRLAQSQPSEDATDAVSWQSTTGINQGLQSLPTSENIRRAEEHLTLLQNPVFRQIALSSLLPQSSYLNRQHLIGERPISFDARRQSESDLDLLRRQQQQMQQQSLLSHMSVATSSNANAYLQALLQQSHSASSPSRSIRDEPGMSTNDTLLSMLGVNFNQSRDAASNRQIMGAASQNIDGAFRTLYRQNQNEVASSRSAPDVCSLGLTTAPTSGNSLRTLQQQYAAAITAQREQYRLELQRQILIDSNIRARYLVAKQIPQQISNNTTGSHSSDGTISTSLPIVQRTNIARSNITRLNSTERLPHIADESQMVGQDEGERSQNDDRKRNARNEMKSSDASSTMVEAKKPRIGKHKK